MTIGVDDSSARRAVELELHVEFPAVPLDQVTILVACLWAHFDNAPVRDFVPLLVRKQAKEELRDHIGPPADAAVSPAEPRAQARPRSTPLLLEGSAP